MTALCIVEFSLYFSSIKILQKMKLGFLLTICVTVVVSLNLNLIENFLKNSVQIKNVIVLSCSTRYHQRLAVFLSNSNIYFKFIFISKFEDFDNKISGKCVFLVDYSCSDSKSFLMQSSKLNYFNSSYHWIISNEQNISSDIIFANISNIGINSQINLLSKLDDNAYDIFDVYSKGLQIGAPIIVKKIGLWSSEDGLKMLNQPTPIFHRKNRGDLNGLEMRGGEVSISKMFAEAKHHKAIIDIMAQLYNFK